MNVFNLDYYFAFESDLRKFSRYIGLNSANFPTYSLELARLLMAVCAEIEVTFKEIAKRIDPKNSPRDIEEIRDIIEDQFMSVRRASLGVPILGQKIK